jgi:hypothetical protein
MKTLRISGSLLAFGLVMALAACSGGGGGGGSTPPVGSPAPGGSPPPTATPTSSPSGGTTITSNGSFAKIYDGTTSPLIFGTDNWQKGGVSSSDTGDGDVAGGFATPTNGNTTIDSVPCNLGSESSVTSSSYHVHSFLGVYVNGTQYAIPDAIGMNAPSGEPVTTFTDACYIHTHAPSGLIHIEDPTQGASYTAEYPQYNLQSLLDIWGYGSLQNLVGTIAPGFNGTISVYVGTPCPNNAVGCASPAKNPNGDGDDVVTSYTQMTGAANTIGFGHHVAIWVIAGSMPSAGLPGIDFDIEN